MFNGLLKVKDDEIEVLNTKVLELQNDLEFQEEKDKDFMTLQRLAEDEAETISSLEKENIKLIEAINELEEQMKDDKFKLKSLEEGVNKERDNVLEQLNSTVAQVDNQRKKYQELQNMLTVARDEIIKLEEENGRLKDQVRSDMIGITNAIHIMDDTDIDDDDSDTNTVVDDDRTECDILIDDLDDIADLPGDPS